MPPENITTAVGEPRERSEHQGILLKHMSQLNQRLLGPWENADGQRLPRLTMAEAVAQLYEWSTAYRDHPELARDFAVMAARLARRLPIWSKNPKPGRVPGGCGECLETSPMSSER